MRLLPALLFALLAVPAIGQDRTVAITLDDLPYVGGSLEQAEAATDRLLGALAAHDAPADVFVTAERAGEGADLEHGLRLLRRWRDAGHALHNHSFSHPRYSTSEPAAYLADVARGHGFVAALLAEVPEGDRVRYFRAPFNDLGDSAESRAALQADLESRGVTLAPFTIEHAGYLFDALYTNAYQSGDTAQAERIGEAYLAQLDSAFAFAEDLSRDTFGREIPQVFLIHANAINARYLKPMLDRLAARGYRFVSLAEALEDPAYASEDAYLRKWGVSWLHRWRVALGLPNRLRDEPEPPGWVLEAYTAL